MIVLKKAKQEKCFADLQDGEYFSPIRMINSLYLKTGDQTSTRRNAVNMSNGRRPHFEDNVKVITRQINLVET